MWMRALRRSFESSWPRSRARSQEVTPPPESVALALTVARRGMDLRVLLKIYGAGRLAMLGFVDESIEALPIGPELKRALLVRVWGSAMRWLEVTTELFGGNVCEGA